MTCLRQDGLIIVFGLRLGLKMCSNQCHRSNGDGVMYCTTRPRPNWPGALSRTVIVTISMQMQFNHENCRDKGPKSIYWGVGLVRGCLVVRGQINDSENVRIRAARASYD